MKSLSLQTLSRILRWWVIACIGILFLSSARVQAQGGPGDLWQTFTRADGILSGNVLVILPDPDGTLWFGTEAGVSHYDGRWRDPLTERNGLPAGRVRALARGDDGSLWIGTEGGGVGHLTADGQCCRKYTTADGLPSNDVRALLVHADLGVWAGTSNGLARLQNGRFEVEGTFVGQEITAIVAGATGSLWVAGPAVGVWMRPPGGEWTATRDRDRLTRGQWVILFLGQNDQAWAGTDQGLAYLSERGWERWPLSGTGTDPRVFAIAQDRDGGLWVGTDDGCFFDTDPFGEALLHLTAQPNGLINNNIRAMAFDSDDALWVGTIAGVNRYAGRIWLTVWHPALTGQPINAIVTDRQGRTWVGTEQRGLLAWDGAIWEVFDVADGLPDNRVVALFEDQGERLWVGTGSGVGYHAPTGRWQFFDRAPGLAGLPVYAFAQDAAGRLWLGTEGGLSQWSEATGFSVVPALAGKRVNAVLPWRDGTLWVGTLRDGLFRLIGDTVQPVAGPDSQPVKIVAVNGLVEGPDAALWVNMYDAGLWRWGDGVWLRMDAPLVTPKVLSLSKVRGHLWVGTRVGIDRYDGQTWQSYVGGVLPSPQVQVVAAGTEDSVWIGTAAGLVHYRPERQPPWVVVETVNSIQPRGDVVTLTDNVLQEVRLQGGDLGTRSEHLKFLVQLVGVDVLPYTAAGNLVRYPNKELTPGEHLLRVWARDAAFNYSAPRDVVIRVPRMVRLPGGRSVQADIVYGVLLLAILAVGGLAAAGGTSLQAWARARRERAQQAARQHEALARRFNPYISGEPVRRPDMFFGRQALLAKIVNALHQNSIMIHGERRMGKTSLLYQLAEQLRAADDPQWAFVPVWVDLEGTPQERFFHLLMDAIWGVLQGYLTAERPSLRFHESSPQAYSDRDFSADLHVLLDALKAIVAPKEVRLILLLDEMDVMNTYDKLIQQQMRRIFMSPLAHNLGAVVAGVRISKEWDREESPWYNLFNEIILEPFDEESARRLLIEPVQGVYEWTAEALAFVIAHAEGQPYRLQQYGLEAVNHMLAEQRTTLTLADVQAAHEVIEKARTE